MRQRSEDRRRAAIDAHEAWKVARILSGESADGDPFEPGSRARMTSASAIAPEQVEWLWPGRIPLGMLTLFSGDPKLGKSLATLSLIAAVTRGGPLPGTGPDGPAMAPRGSVILLSAEDDPARTIVPRLRAAGADLERVHILSSMVDPEFDGLPGDPGAEIVACERMPTLAAEDLEVIEHLATALGDCRLIVFDPVSAYLGGRADHRSADLRRLLAPLRDLAQRLAAAIVLITHHTKSGPFGTNGKYRVLGSIAYVGVCRANFLFLPDPDDPTGRRVLMLDNGGNLAPKQPALAYVIRDDGAAPFCDWLPETVALDADAALARAARASKSGASGKGARRRDCQEWLRGYLAVGTRPATECHQAALAAGFTRSVLEGARIALAVRCVRSGFGKGASYHWYLPEAAGEPAESTGSGAPASESSRAHSGSETGETWPGADRHPDR